MPDLYRAPEIVLGIPWNEKIDIWSVGVMASHRPASTRRAFLLALLLISIQVWDLFEGKRLFTERLPNREESEAAHLARMVALLGPPPPDLLKRGSKSGRYFDDSDQLHHPASNSRSTCMKRGFGLAYGKH